MSQEQIETLNISIEQAKKCVDDAITLDKLVNNKDFKKLILEGYFKDTASRLVLLKAEPHMRSKEHQEAITADIDAIGGFRQHLVSITQLGERAKQDIQNDRDTREEMLNEE